MWIGNCSFPTALFIPSSSFFFNWFFYSNDLNGKWQNKLLQIRFKWFKKSWDTPFSHSGLSLYKFIKAWIKDLPAWINIPLWDVWDSFLSLFYHIFSFFSTIYSHFFFYWDNNFSESIAHHNGRAFYALNECNYLPNEVVYIAIYSVTAE